MVTCLLCKGPAPIWDDNLMVKGQCLDETCCIEAQYQTASPALRYTKYNLQIRENTTKQNYAAETEIKSSGREICHLRPGFYEIELSASGECPAWEKSSKIFITLEIPLKPTEKIWYAIIGVFAALAIGVFIIAVKSRIWNGFPALGSSHKTPAALNCGRRKSPTDAVSDSEGLVFGGTSTTVLLLYVRDHGSHVNMIKSFAEILRKYGGFEVNIDQWFEIDEVQRNDWLGKQIERARVVIIFSSDGSRLLQEAFLENRMYRKYINSFPASFQISEALSLAEKLPSLRRKLVKVSAEYSTIALSMSGWCTPEFVIPAQLPELVCFLHGAPPDSEWSCKQQCLHSKQYKSMLHHCRKMSHLVARTPNLFERTFGPAEDRLDSGIDQLSSRLWQEGSFDASAGGDTEVYTLHSPDPPLLSGFGCQWPAASQKASDLPRLNTEMPKIEEMWRAHALSGSSPVSSETVNFERFQLTLMHMASIPGSSGWSVGGGSEAAHFSVTDPLPDTASCKTISMSDIETVDNVRL